MAHTYSTFLSLLVKFLYSFMLNLANGKHFLCWKNFRSSPSRTFCK